MNNNKLIKLIRNNADFQYIFMYNTDVNTEKIFIPDYMIENFSFVEWIYLSEIPRYALIGLDKNNKVYVLDEDCEGFYLCDNLYEIPFVFINAYINGNNKKFKLHNEEIYQPYLNKLNFYIKWCEDNNINIDEKYLEILKQ